MGATWSPEEALAEFVIGPRVKSGSDVDCNEVDKYELE
jgi:hypothetical protein